MKKILLFLYIFVFIQPTFGYEIAFPLEKEVTLSQDGIFFVGKTNKKEEVWINDKKVTSKKNGSFAEIFKLKEGENIFFVGTENERNKDKYVIIYQKPINIDSKFIEISATDYKTICDDVILRSTPVDAGMNRLGYLPKGTELEITGIKNEFSRVYLNDKVCGWVMSKYIIPEQRQITTVGEYRGENIKTDNYYTERCYKFSKNLPYAALYNDKKLYIDVYNVENRPNQTFHKEIKLEFPYCYSSKMNNGELNIKIPKKSMDEIKIVIDAGHGGDEHGAIGCMSDLEKDMNLKAAQALKKELKSCGYKVYMTRDKDKFVSLNERIKFSVEKNALIFVSVHMNSVPESCDPHTHSGSETYYYTDFSKELAQCVQTELTQSIKTHDNGIKQASFAVIRPTEYVSILVETAYMVNPEDVEIYKSKDFFKNVGIGIANGIKKYLQENSVGD